MSFTKKIKEKTGKDLTDKADKVFDNVYPTIISNIESNAPVEEQEVWEKFDDKVENELKCNIKSAYKTINDIIKENILSCFEDAISGNLESKDFTNIDKSQCIYELLNSVNIYFVNSKMCYGKTFDKRKIPSDTVWSIKLDKKELHNMIENEKFEEANKREVVPVVILGCYKRDTERYFAGEGLKSENGSVISSFDDVSKNCSIFLWIDHIYEISDIYDNISFEALLTFVLLHELMHLMMDVFDETEFGINGAGNLKDLGQLYGYFREESLANALALYLCDATRNDALVYSILDYFVEGQTTPYQTGLLYIEKDLLKKAVTNWMKCKKGKYLTKQLAKEWLLEVTTESPRQSELIRIEDAIATLVP